MKYYAIADLHGRYDLLDKALHKIWSTNTENMFKIITLGDYIDRGPESNLIIQRLIRESKECKNTYVCLQGNHESMAVECITHNLHPDWWVGNGGKETLASYGWSWKDSPYSQMAYSVVPKDHFDWMKGLPLFFETEKQVFVHAGIPMWNMNLPPNNSPKGERLAKDMQWMRYDYRDSGGWKGKHVVHGHEQYGDGPHQWLNEKKGGRTALDTWAYHTGRLVIGVFDDTQKHALEFIEVKDG